jgi:cytochrome c553
MLIEGSMRIILVLFFSLAGAVMAQAPTFEPVGSIHQLMLGIIVPASNAIFRVPNESPKDDKEWAAVQNSALILAESGNLLMIDGRAKDQTEWIKYSRALVDAGATAFQAANAKDADALTAVGDRILATCSNCHQKYEPKQ